MGTDHRPEALPPPLLHIQIIIEQIPGGHPFRWNFPRDARHFDPPARFLFVSHNDFVIGLESKFYR